VDTAFKVLVSAPKQKHLSPEQQRFLQEVINKVTAAGFRIVDVDGVARLEEQAREIGKLQGILVLAFAQWVGERAGRKPRDEAVFPSEFNHVHTAIGCASRRPLLVLREKSVAERGALRPSLGCRTAKIPSSLDPAWLATPEFEKQFQVWLGEVKAQCHVFFGYSGVATNTANAIQVWLRDSGLKVLDWKNFRPGESILSRIEQAANQAACGLFLLTADDLKIKNNQLKTAPRDNVIFEAGYFARAKGKDRTLIVLEDGVELLSDLGGDIYLKLGSQRDPSTIEGRLARYFQDIL
jgi:Predicted nucleotide-binding protein containing TIR-like domain